MILNSSVIILTLDDNHTHCVSPNYRELEKSSTHDKR
jgi:hypothetical protein